MTILLIDDEFLVLKGIETILNAQQEFPAKVVPYIDSVEALAAIPSIRPDVIIIDICMPELNGLSFIEAARNQGYAGSFIIISGHEEVTYLKRALELQVVTYISKPINKQKLIGTLLSLSQSQVTPEQLLDRLHYLISMPASSHSSRHKASDWEKMFPKNAVALIAAHRPSQADKGEMVLTSLKTYFQPVHYLRHHSMDIYLVALPQGVQRHDVSAICDLIGPVEPDCWYGVSKVYPQKDIIEQLVKGSNLQILLEAICDAILRELDLSQYALCDSDFEIARVFLSSDAATRKRTLLDSFQHTNSLEEWFVRSFTEIIASILLRGDQFPGKGKLRIFYQLLWNEKASTYELCDSLMALHEHYLRFIRQAAGGDQKYSPKIEEAIFYIGKHFSEDLSLVTVANSVGLNRSYFSAVFSKEVGVPFLTYLKQVRMNEACRLLETNPQMPVETIASRVGYQTIGQFYKVFKTIFNESPKSWREHTLGLGDPES